MLNFIDLNIDIAFQDKFSIPDIGYGLQVGLKNAPLDFQYQSDEAISTFIAVKVDNQGNAIDSISLSTGLITSSGGYHICDGLTDFAVDLDCGLYYFKVNGRYQSEYFQVFTELVQGSLTNTNIAISGIEFYDSQIDIFYQDKFGAPDYLYGIQYSEDTYPLDFEYLASGAISSFKAVNYKTGVETSLSTSLVTGDGTTHKCTGLTAYSSTLPCGVYYYVVNDRFKSDLFAATAIYNVSIGIDYDIIGSTLKVY